jgi:hypothetical protein
MIRFRALKAWCAREDVVNSPNTGSRTVRDICEVAASFQLNDRWEFDADAFCAAVDVVQQRTGHPTDGVAWLNCARSMRREVRQPWSAYSAASRPPH